MSCGTLQAKPKNKAVIRNTPKTTVKIKIPGEPVDSAKKSSWVDIPDGFVVFTLQFARDLPTPLKTKGGYLVRTSKGDPKALLHANHPLYLYFSHHNSGGFDLSRFKPSAGNTYFKFCYRLTRNKETLLEIDIWKQKDWIIVHNEIPADEKADHFRLVEWNERYEIAGATRTAGVISQHTEQIEKDEQEKLNGMNGIARIARFIKTKTTGSHEVWAGNYQTIKNVKNQNPHALAKILCCKTYPQFTVTNVNGIRRPGGDVSVTSINEIQTAKAGTKNIVFKNYHTYVKKDATELAALDPVYKNKQAIRQLESKTPPNRSLLMGDICWQAQGHSNSVNTNTCGPHSISAAVGYWLPYVYNGYDRNGFHIVQKRIATRAPVFGRTGGGYAPGELVPALHTLGLNAKMFLAGRLNDDLKIRWLKLWIVAGVPVIVLVNEGGAFSGLHYKVLVGYSGNLLYFNNSSYSAEDDDTGPRFQYRVTGVDYRHAPIGNDIDHETTFLTKWKKTSGAGERYVLIPVWPKTDTKFASDTKA